MGVTDQPKRLQPCLTAKKDADFSPHSSCHPPCPCLLCPPEQTQPDQRPAPGSEPEPTQHQVLHRQPGHRLRGLGSCPGGRHPILRQPGVQPVRTGAAPGTPTPRAPTIGSSATPTLTTESSDSLEALPPLPLLRMPDSRPTAGEQGG